jgi:ribosomal protein S27AE
MGPEITDGRMNCWRCGTQMIWGGDHHIDDEVIDSDYLIVSNFQCPRCESIAEFYHSKKRYS